MPGMLTALGALVISAMIGGMTAYEQQPRDPSQVASNNFGQKQTTTLKATGTVKAYEAGKTIEVEAKGAPHVYDLTSPDATYAISPDIAVGSKVKVMEKMDPTGHKMVTIEAAGKSDKPASQKRERPMSEKPPIETRPIR